jgi:adenylate cyclase
LNIQTNLKRHLPLLSLNLLLLIFFLTHVVSNEEQPMRMKFIDQMENLAYDARVLFSIEKTEDPRIVIVDIDEKSLAEEGRWPWGRDRLAKLVDELFIHYQAKIVGFDVVFAEPDESSGLRVLQQLAREEFRDVPEYISRLGEIKESLDYDRLFSESLSNRPVILGYYFSAGSENEKALRSGVLPKHILTKKHFRGRSISVPVATGFGANLENLQKHAAGGGHFNPAIDDDGVVRRVPMLYEFEERYYESLSLAVVRKLLGEKTVEPVFVEELAIFKKSDYTGLEWLRVGPSLIPVDEKIQALVPYRGRQGSFPYISATDVLHGRVDVSVLKNTIVLVGTSAPGLFDLRSTPVQNKYPGVEINANLIAGILDQNIKEKPAYVLGAEFIILLLVGLLITILLPLLTPVRATLVTVFLLLFSITINLVFWRYSNLVLPIASGVMMILMMFLLNMSYGFFIERRRKGEITHLFGQYIPPELVDEMSDDPTAYSLDAEEKELTVLFSDVRGFTTLSEGMNPQELAALMNEFLTPITKIIHDNRGTIDKYMGDAVMAFWGAPINDPNHARHALKAGLAMIERISALRDEFLARGWPEIRIGVGINTGEMSVGNMGSEFRMAYTVMGDTVNLGSRLEGLTRQYGVDVIVGKTVRDAVPEFVFRELDRVKVKGKNEPVAIYEPLVLKEEVSKDELDELKLYAQALRYYRNKEWDKAELQFLNLQKMHSQKPLYDFYIERMKYFKNNPPPEDWDGVFTFTSK